MRRVSFAAGMKGRSGEREAGSGTRRTVSDGGYEAVDRDGPAERHLGPMDCWRMKLLHGIVRKRERGVRVCALPGAP